MFSLSGLEGKVVSCFGKFKEHYQYRERSVGCGGFSFIFSVT